MSLSGANFYECQNTVHQKKERKKKRMPAAMRVEADCFAPCLPLTEDGCCVCVRCLDILFPLDCQNLIFFSSLNVYYFISNYILEEIPFNNNYITRHRLMTKELNGGEMKQKRLFDSYGSKTDHLLFCQPLPTLLSIHSLYKKNTYHQVFPRASDERKPFKTTPKLKLLKIIVFM